MDSLEHLCSTLEGTYAGRSIADLLSLYAGIEEKTAAFCKEHEIACPSGCGTCCEHFMPDITASEARLVAAYLLFIKKDLSLIENVYESVGNHEGPCPLYLSNTPYHCSVYPARPLICRLFAACATQDKQGEAVFRRCKYDREGCMPSFIRFEGDVPVMQDYSYALRSSDDQEGEVGYLADQVAVMLDQLKFLAHLIESDNSNPDDTPTPIAS